MRLGIVLTVLAFLIVSVFITLPIVHIFLNLPMGVETIQWKGVIASIAIGLLVGIPLLAIGQYKRGLYRQKEPTVEED
ncbi:hypothetical protein ES703_111390 [subsurface metagenome]